MDDTTDVTHDEWVDRLGLPELVRLAGENFDEKDLAEAFPKVLGSHPDGGAPDAKAVAAREANVVGLQFALLRYFLEDGRSSRFWDVDSGDRDEIVLVLWGRVRDRLDLKSELWSRRFYEARLLDWALGRYDPSTARRFVVDGWWSKHAHTVLFVLVTLVVSAPVIVKAYSPWALDALVWPPAALLAVYSTVVAGTAWTMRSSSNRSGVECLLRSIDSFSARLGAAIVVGVLAVSPSARWVEWGASSSGWLVTLGVLLTSVGYLGLQITRRVFPPMAGFWRRWWAVTACGLAHSLSIAALALCLGGWMSQERTATPLQLVATLAVGSLAVGLVLHIIWDETPVTKPL